MAPLILMLCIALVVGLYSLYQLKLAKDYVRQGRLALSWPQAPGRIASAQVIEHSSESAASYYEPRIVYTYAVGDRSFTSDRIGFRDVRGMKRTAKALVDKFPPGREVMVFHDPQDAGRSVLEPGDAGTGKTYAVAITGLVVAAGLIGAGLFMFFRGA